MSTIGILMDYLMIHFEILELYAEGASVEKIAQEMLGLPAILKDQPKKLGPKRFELIRIKFNAVQ